MFLDKKSSYTVGQFFAFFKNAMGPTKSCGFLKRRVKCMGIQSRC